MKKLPLIKYNEVYSEYEDYYIADEINKNRATNNELIEKKESKFKVGDEVRIIEGMGRGKTGKIDFIDLSDTPYLVRFDDGLAYWKAEDHLELEPTPTKGLLQRVSELEDEVFKKLTGGIVSWWEEPKKCDHDWKELVSGETYCFRCGQYKPKKWKPEVKKDYLYIDSDGMIVLHIWEGTCSDEYRYRFGNCFETMKEAEAMKDKMEELLNN